MFKGAVAFNQDISSWDVSSILDLTEFFNGAVSFNQDIREWDVHPSVILTGMFDDATAMIQYFDVDETPSISFFTDENQLPVVTGSVDLGSMQEDGTIRITQADLLANSSDPDAVIYTCH